MPSATRASRLAFPLGLLAIALVAVGILWMRGRREAPVPPPPSLLSPTAQFTNPEASIEYYRARLRQHPEETNSWVALAQVLLQQAVATGREPEYVPEARDALAEALRISPNDLHARLLQGSLYNTLHQFEHGRDMALGIIRDAPHLAYAHGLLVDALVELGEYDAAIAAADSMIAIRPSMGAYARVSYIRELRGDGEGAIAAMRMAADAGMPGHTDRAWALYNLGHLYMAEARLDTAAYVFRGILEEVPYYPYAVAGLGRISMLNGDLDGAIAQFEQAYSAAPRDVFLEDLAEAYTLKGEHARAEGYRDQVESALTTAREMGEVVDMEEADFLADRGHDLPRALQLATVQIQRRPGHLHANETYAWALHKNGRSADAVPYIERALRFRSQDAMAHHRAAQIYRDAGRPAEAARQERLALEYHLEIESPSAAAEARENLAALDAAVPVQTASVR